MTFAYHDQDDDDLLIQQCGQDLHALREAFRINDRSDAAVLSHACNDSLETDDHLLHSSVDDDGYGNEDDDSLLLSIQNRFGIVSQPASRSHGGSYGQSLEEEDDEEILQAVRQRFGSTKVDQGKEKKQKHKEKLKIYRKRTQDDTSKRKSTIKGGKTGKSFKAAEELESVAVPPKGDTKDIESDFTSICDNPNNFEDVLGKKTGKSFKATQGLEYVTAPAKDDIRDIESMPDRICNNTNDFKDVSVEPRSRPEISDSSPEHIEPTAFSFPGQVEIFSDNVECVAEGSMGGVVNCHSSSDISSVLQGQSSKTSLNALKKNRQFQEVLKKKLQLIEKKLQENADLKKRVKAILEIQNAKTCSKVPSFSCNVKKPIDMGSKFGKVQPPDNDDVAKLRAVQKKYSLEVEIKTWSNHERLELVKGVKQQIQESQMRLAMDSFNAETHDAKALDDQLKVISKQSLTAHDIRASLELVNWAEVARMYVVGRTATECWIQWSNYEDPLISQGPWTKSEDKRLWSIARNHKLCNWVQIAQELGGHRSVAQCLMRYQRSLNAGIVRSNWTEEEDKQLRAAVEQCGDQDWQAVAARLEGRTGTQCWNRWSKILHPMRKKSGRWDVTEDKRLKMAVSVYGARMWKLIAEHVPGRTEAQCRERWCNVLDPSLSYEAWTVEEDLRLDEAVKKHGYRWSTIANDLKPRTDNQCWRRWKQLHPNDVLALQKNNKIQKVALMHNFVGRKKERPTLQPSDFITQQALCLEDNQASKKRRRASDGPMSTSKKRKTVRSEKIKQSRARSGTVRRKVAGERVSNAGKLGKRCSNPQIRGAKAFVKFLEEVARMCEDNISKNCEDGESLVVSGKVEVDSTIGASGVCSPAHERKESEENADVETAVRAVLSWPFFCGLSELLRRKELDH